VSPIASLADRRFREFLAGLLVFGALSQVFILTGALGNPFSLVPTSDALVYWEWSGRIARGEWLQDTPFLSAPLYPYFLGVLRMLGFGLAGIYAVQALLHLGTAGLIARIGRKRGDKLTGLVAAGLFLLLLEPAFTTGRLLNGSLQLFLIAALWERLLTLNVHRKKRHAMTFGCLLGLTCLASPPMLLALPLFVLLALRGAGVSRAGLALLFSFLTIFPASAHNYIVSGEWITISAQSGITYHHGNQAESRGIYTPAEGVSADRLQQNADALAIAQTELGPSAGWNDASQLYMTRGMKWQVANPGDALALFARKLWLFITARVYGDVYLPTLERTFGWSSHLWIAPVQLAWLLPFAFTVLLLRMRRDRWSHAPEAIYLGIPLLVVCFFWYSPRYRMPATPAIVMLAAYGVVHLLRNQGRIVLTAALGAGLLTVYARPALDDAERWKGTFYAATGEALLSLGAKDHANRMFQLAAEEGDQIADFRLAFEELKASGASPDEILRAANGQDSAYVQRTLATLAAQRGYEAEALRLFRRALTLDPNDFRSETGLGNVHLTAKRPAEALPHHERAVELHPEGPVQQYGLGLTLQALGRSDEAETAFRATLEREDIAPARAALMALAWELVVHPQDERRDGERALAIASEFGNAGDPGTLSTLAAALAETGDFTGAIEYCDKAIEILRSRGASVSQLETRRSLYAAGKPWRQ